MASNINDIKIAMAIRDIKAGIDCRAKYGQTIFDAANSAIAAEAAGEKSPARSEQTINKTSAVPAAQSRAVDAPSALLPMAGASPRVSAVAPGLVGEIADYIMASAMFPSRKFAAATALGVVGTLISRRVAGPSGPRGTGTHLYQALIGPTGSGKEHIRSAGKLLLSEAKGEKLIGPGRFKSGAGIVRFLADRPTALCFMDELGAMFAMLADPRTNVNVRDQNEVLRELWGLAWGRYDSPAGASDETQAVLCPALGLIGMTTPRELYRACKSRDVANGFLNRFMFVEEPEVPEYRKVEPGAMEVPKPLKDRLRELYKPSSLLDWDGKPALRLGWGPGAEEIFDAVREGNAAESNELKRELFVRTPEKIVRVASILTAGRFDEVVSREDMEWAREWVIEGDETLLAGISEYMEDEKLEFGGLCREVLKRIKAEGGEMTKRELGRSFQGNVRYKAELDNALGHLTETGQLELVKLSTGGRPSWIYRLEVTK